jgi:hypothetical protein
LKESALFYLPHALSVRITMQIQLHEENNHGKRSAKKKQGSKEAQKETDSGYLSCWFFELMVVAGRQGMLC